MRRCVASVARPRSGQDLAGRGPSPRTPCADTSCSVVASPPGRRGGRDARAATPGAEPDPGPRHYPGRQCRREAFMYLNLRRYPRIGVGREAIERSVEDELLPELQKQAGFGGYCAFWDEEGAGVSVSLFDDP